MTTMMDWEETSPSPGGSASGSSLNGHSETEDEGIVNNYHRSNNFVTSLNLKLNSKSLVFGNSDRSKHNHYNNYFPTKENSLILNDGFNGLNLNPSPPAPAVGQDLSISSSASTINFPLPLPRSPLTSSSPKAAVGQSQSVSASQGSLSSSTAASTKKHKPIPPPLDLSLGASTLNSTPSSSTDSATFQYSGTFYSPYYLGSPKFNQAEKSLPLRKRWHSWSPKLMNCNEDLIPLYSETPTGISSNGSAARSSKGGADGGPVYAGSKSNGSLQPPPYSSIVGRGGPGNGKSPPQSAGLQTPTPFYTPNEPSPRFMNSPVFSYSTPDTTLYQGPYSPIRTTTLYPPGSPFLNSNLNTPTFIITNLSPPSSSATSSSSSASAPTVGVGASSSGSTTSSSSSSTLSSSTQNNPPVTSATERNITTTAGQSSPFPTTVISPVSSAQTSNQSYEESQSDTNGHGLGPLASSAAPNWNIFLSGTKVRFISESGQTTGWYLVDYLSQLSDLTLILGLSVKGEYAPHGLSVKQYVVTSSARERVQITFTPANNEQLRHPNIEADCEAGHPFIVMKKGICAVKPEGFISAYGNPCSKLEVLDVCVRLNFGAQAKQAHYHHHQNIHSSNLFMSNSMPPNPVSNGLRNGFGGSMMTNSNSMSRSMIPPHMFHPMDEIKPNFPELRHSYLGDAKASLMEDIKPFPHPMPPLPMPSVNHHSPIQHHHQLDVQVKRETYSHMETDMSPPIYDSGPKKLKTKTKSKKMKESNNNGCPSPSGSSGEPKGRRPMNAFLVYAKEKRPLLIQMYPGKDNRSISTLLGDSWKNLDPEQKNYYIKTAKDSADEQKKLHPDCWKRKRTQQQAQQQSGSALPMKMEALTKVI